MATNFLIGFIFFCSTWVFIHTLVRLFYLVLLKKTDFKKVNYENEQLKNFPLVTFQIPVYNELYVVEECLNHLCAMEYPKEKMEIQVLDDSNDDTSEIIKKFIAKKSLEGFQFIYLHRTHNEGYKAGALRDALYKANGEFIVIFDCDFYPHPKFLLKTLKKFEENKQLGFVQTPWGHQNKDYSILTKAQAIGLDAHYNIEQVVKGQQQFWINFNGTGGIWRKQCIIDAGGWDTDNLTEDLDISYRAQCKGWTSDYEPSIISEGELPITVRDYQQQQYRWTKGAAQCFKKLMIPMVQSKSNWKQKFFAFVHLCNPFNYLLTGLLGWIAPLLLLVDISEHQAFFLITIPTIYLIGFIGLLFYHYSATEKNSSFFLFLAHFFAFTAIQLGITTTNSIAAISGLFGKNSPFLRTPKYHLIAPDKQALSLRAYFKSKKRWTRGVNYFAFLYFGTFLIWSIGIKSYAPIGIIASFFVGIFILLLIEVFE